MEEIKAIAELGSKVVGSHFFDMTQNKKNTSDFLQKVILEDGEINQENMKKAALMLSMNKIQKMLKRSCKIYMEADSLICQIGKDKRVTRPSDDWLEYFEDLCCKAADETIQKMWARILVKEHLDSGSVTKAMMNVLALMDRTSAIAFEKICSLVYMLECDGGEVHYIPLVIYNDILNHIIENSFETEEGSVIREAIEDYSKYLPKQKEIEYLRELGLLKLSAVHDESEIYSQEQMELYFRVGTKIYVTQSIYSENDYYYVPTGQAFFTQAGMALYHALNRKSYKYLYEILKSYIVCREYMWNDV